MMRRGDTSAIGGEQPRARWHFVNPNRAGLAVSQWGHRNRVDPGLRVKDVILPLQSDIAR